ncbi:MAG: Fic family protein [Planctomycetes bacterium]|nr:Fic family protein [Planctomycetota bacterium]
MATSRRRGHRWQPIADLPPEWSNSGSSEAAELVARWQLRRKTLAAEQVDRFLAGLVRSWSIETGILERIYTLDEGVTRTLVEMGFDAAHVSHGSSDLPAGQLMQILRDHQAVAEGLFAFVAGRRELTTSYIKELHAALLRHQETAEGVDQHGVRREIPLIRGDYKEQPNNPGDPETGEILHHYCPPEHVASEMERLVQMHRDHSGIPFEVEAAWLHHRFTQIHPFQDGNGRVARTLATLACLRAGSLPLLIDRTDKTDYIAALEAGDAGDLRPLIRLFTRQQQRILLRAIQSEFSSPATAEDVTQILADASRRLRGRLADELSTATPAAWARCRMLEGLVLDRLEGLSREVSQSSVPMQASVDADLVTESERAALAAAAAEECGYESDPSLAPDRSGQVWHAVRLDWGHHAPRRHVLAIAFHAVAFTNQEILAAVAVLVELTRDRPAAILDSETVCQAPFTFTALQPFDDTERRFRGWLEEALVRGLDAWRRLI